MTDDHYRTLNISADADAEVVRAAYVALMRKYHPDRAGDDAAAMAKAQSIGQAFAVLGDPVKRAKYDQTRRGAASSRTARPSQGAPSTRTVRSRNPVRAGYVGAELRARQRRITRVRWVSIGLFVAAVGLVIGGGLGVWAQINS